MTALPYPFVDPSLWTEALTHSSWANERGGRDYERLEHLGDAVLQLSVTTLLLARVGDSAEGDLTHLRQQVVNSHTLAALAQELGLDREIRLGAGAEAEGTRSSPSVLSDVAEAVIGAVYRDGGFDAAHALVSRWLGPRIDALVAGGIDHARHPKSLLQEHTQRDVGLTPVYVLTDQQGPAHAPHFSIEVRLEDRPIGRGDGPSRKEAERLAALDALTRDEWRGAP